jgi:hypothetical protein
VTYTNGHTYICKAAHTSSASITPGNTTYWDDKTIGDMIYSLNSNYANITKWTAINSLLSVSTSKNIVFQYSNYNELLLILGSSANNDRVLSSIIIPKSLFIVAGAQMGYHQCKYDSFNCGFSFTNTGGTLYTSANSTARLYGR